MGCDVIFNAAAKANQKHLTCDTSEKLTYLIANSEKKRGTRCSAILSKKKSYDPQYFVTTQKSINSP
jgi:hypothetical protein